MTDVLAAHHPWSHKTMPSVSHKSSTRPTQLRKITFFRNGDRYFPGKQVNIIPHNYPTLRHFLQELSSTIDLPYGVRRLFTPIHGSEITDINLLKDGDSYVCASFEPFQKLEYSTSHIPRVTFNMETCKATLIAFSFSCVRLPRSLRLFFVFLFFFFQSNLPFIHLFT